MFLIVVGLTWIGITKNAPSKTWGPSAGVINAEKYLEYLDGAAYKAIGGVTYDMNENNACVAFPNAEGLTWQAGTIAHALNRINYSVSTIVTISITAKSCKKSAAKVQCHWID